MYGTVFQNQHHVPCQWREKSHFTRPVTTMWCKNACFHAARRLGLAGKSKRFMTSEANKLARSRTRWTVWLETHLCKTCCLWRNSGRNLVFCLLDKIIVEFFAFNLSYLIEWYKFLALHKFSIPYSTLNIPAATIDALHRYSYYAIPHTRNGTTGFTCAR